MPLNPGTRLGNYEVLAMVGAGGMGEVYRAHDSRLGRDVAIKTSAAQFTERFEREARAVAALNHPNICTLHDVGPNYLVMEYVDGESPKGPLPLDEALRIARQIANALDAAHEKGIVHRDLKPGNIKVKADGSVKVLDFGLAKTMAPGTGGVETADASHSPTISLAATQAGMILGTAAYMAPEQARGKPVDKRVDIWAFGVVLYELLTGERLFDGDDVTEILASVVKGQPDLTKVPEEVRKLLGKCLEKDPKKRLRDIGDVWELLEEPAPALPSATAPPVRFRFAPWIVAAVLAAGLSAIAWRHFRESPPPEHVLRYNILGPEDATILSFAVSPDGRYVAISAGISKRELWLQPLNSLQAQPLQTTEDATFPFWSPDSRYIGFFAQGRLKKIAVSGGPSQTIAAAPNGAGGTWNSDGTIVFAPNFNGNAMQRVQTTGEPSDVIKTKFPAAGPVFLPDGRHFLYTQVSRGQEGAGIYFASLDGKENRHVLGDLSTVAFVPSGPTSSLGQILFVREGNLISQPFDADKGQVTGEVFPVAEGISSLGTRLPFVMAASASQNGILLYAGRGLGAVGANQIVWYDRTGKVLGNVSQPGEVWEPSISPDGKMAAFARFSNGIGGSIWLHDLIHGVDQRFTSDPSRNDTPVWSPNSDRIIFRSTRSGPQQLFIRPTNGSGKDELLPTDENPKFASQWSKEGFVVYSDREVKTTIDLWVVSVDGDRKPVPFLKSEFDEAQGQISPDGHWMAYMSDVSGQREIYVRQFPSGQNETRISTAGGEQPRWRGDGKELFFVAADGKMMAVDVKAVNATKPTFDHGTPAPLFHANIAFTAETRAFQYDVTADGKRFLVATNVSPPTSTVRTPITVIVNWLKR